MYDATRDLPLTHTYEIGHNKFTISRKDPYGLFAIKYERGPVPNELSGFYTTLDKAKTAIQVYAQKKDRVLKEVQELVEADKKKK